MADTNRDGRGTIAGQDDLTAYRLGLFFAKVAIPAKGYDLCWEWTGAKDEKGYGLFRGADGRVTRAHRFAANFFNGAGQDGDNACHQCDNPGCVNPRHLFWGSAQDNVSDCVSKGRRVVIRGGRHGNAKVTEDDVRDIRARWASGEQQRSIGRAYGVSQMTISSIVNGRTWTHVESAQ